MRERPGMVSMELLSSSSLRSAHDTLITGRDFVAGELLLELPLSAALTKDSAQALPIIRFLDAEDGRPPRGLPHWAALPDDFVLALQLMHLRSAAPPLACDDDSATHPWLAWLEHAPLHLGEQRVGAVGRVVGEVARQPPLAEPELIRETLAR